jgi:ABC-type nitrate/sulfonate/bicarbonate transport system substrate-binding protein
MNLFSIRCILFPIFLLLFLESCTENPGVVEKSRERAKRDTLILALDWSPNVLHAPVFWAEREGYFAEAGLHVEWFSTEIDGYKKKPIHRLIDGEVDLCIGPSEHLFYLSVDGNGKPGAEALATMLQHEQSCFVVKESSEIDRPKHLKGKTYVGYKTPLEKQVLGAMIKNDGGNPVFDMITPGRLDVWESLLLDSGEVAWVFSHWEATLAEHHGVALRKFYPGDFGVPYGYSSVIMARKNRSAAEERKMALFLNALSLAVEDLLQTEDSLVASRLCALTDHPNFDDRAFILKAWTDIRPSFFEPGRKWGEMDPVVWEEWMGWVIENGEEEWPIGITEPDRFFTNEFFR